MKHLFSILLLTLLIFNWFGYRLLSDFLQEQSESRLEARVDDHLYDDRQLIELRIPITLPYHNETKDFERYNGQIELNGIHYQYVKRKIEKGELVLLCLPNLEKQKIENAREQFFKLVNDIDQTASSENTSKKTTKESHFSFKKLLSEYQQESNHWQFCLHQNASTCLQKFLVPYIPNKFTVAPEQPPESC